MDTLVNAALKNPETIKRTGGNAPVMVKNFLKMGYKVLLGAQMSEEFRKEVNPDVKGFCSLLFSTLKAFVAWLSFIGICDSLNILLCVDGIICHKSIS